MNSISVEPRRLLISRLFEWRHLELEARVSCGWVDCAARGDRGGKGVGGVFFWLGRKFRPTQYEEEDEVDERNEKRSFTMYRKESTHMLNGGRQSHLIRSDHKMH
jgi:hypothetical protein